MIEGIDIEWNDNGVELVTKSVTTDQRLKQLVSFRFLMWIIWEKVLLNNFFRKWV